MVIASENKKSCRAAFTLVELLVVIGVIAVLIGMLMPALTRMRQNGVSVKCKAQMHDIGLQLQIYSTTYRDWIFPVGDFLEPGTVLADGKVVKDPGYYRTLGIENDRPNQGKFERWPIFVFEEKIWNPRIITCPADQDPAEEHTYILNMHLADRRDKLVRMGTRVPNRPSSEVLVMGEKRVEKPDYYMGRRQDEPADSEFTIVDPYKHGLKLGSNYLFQDWHVDLIPPQQMQGTLDPWDVNMGEDTSQTGGGQTGQSAQGNPAAP